MKGMMLAIFLGWSMAAAPVGAQPLTECDVEGMKELLTTSEKGKIAAPEVVEVDGFTVFEFPKTATLCFRGTRRITVEKPIVSVVRDDEELVVGYRPYPGALWKQHFRMRELMRVKDEEAAAGWMIEYADPATGRAQAVTLQDTRDAAIEKALDLAPEDSRFRSAASQDRILLAVKEERAEDAGDPRMEGRLGTLYVDFSGTQPVAVKYDCGGMQGLPARKNPHRHFSWTPKELEQQ